MELHEMVYRRCREDAALERMTAVYDEGTAVFYQRPPDSHDEKWESSIQYPRIDYTLDMQENPAQNTSGILMMHVWCDTTGEAEPEDIESRLRELFHATFAQADDFAYSFAWVRSDAFEVKKQTEEAARTIGVTVIFNVMACPSQYTLSPDPIKAMNEWTKEILPDAIVIGKDTINGWIEPTRETPVVYWRLTSQSKGRQHFTHTWMDIGIEGHVYCREAADRLYNLVKINTAWALAGHIPMEDGSPLFLKNYQCKNHMNYISQGQIQTNGRFGILQPWYKNPTGQKLRNVNATYNFRSKE